MCVLFFVLLFFLDHLAAIPSANALRKFMNSVTEIISYRNLYRQYEKPGTYEDAVKDFESLLPKNVQTLGLPGGVSSMIRGLEWPFSSFCSI